MMDEIEGADDDIQSHTLPRPSTNQRRVITIVPYYDDEVGKEKSPVGEHGEYKITFLLSRPGVLDFHADLSTHLLMQSGDSALRLPIGQKALIVTISNANFKQEIRVYGNSQKRISSAELKVKARTFREAAKIAHDLFSPLLSWWSFRFNVALAINGYEIEELKSKTTQWAFGCEGAHKQFELSKLDFEMASTPMLRPIFSTYRDGLAATNPFYRCLSFYKVTECIKTLRSKRRTASGNFEKDYPVEEFPDKLDSINVDREVAHLFEPFLGRKYSWALENYRNLVRNALAHLNPDQPSLIADSYDDSESCHSAIHILQFISWKMIQNEISFTCGELVPDQIL